MNRPLLSICIPTYNRASYFLPECLNSIVSQLTDEEICRQVEIIISDNASNDNTEEVVKEYQKKFNNIKYFKLESTITSALNWDNAIKNSRGKYINTIGDDDIYLRDSLKKFLPVLATTEARLLAVAHVLVVDNQPQLDDNYSDKIAEVEVEKIAESFFAFNNITEPEHMKLGPGFLFFFGDLARDIKKATGYFWKDPIGDHWAVFSLLHGNLSMIFYDWPIVGCRVHAGNHLAYKYKSQIMDELMRSFLRVHDKKFVVFPGPSFTNLGYVGMQDIQFHFPGYQKFPINIDQGLRLHINDVLHLDFSWQKKIKYLFKSFRLIKRQKFRYGAKLFFQSLKYLGKFISTYFKKRSTSAKT